MAIKFNLKNYLLIYITLQCECGSYFERTKVPKFTMDGDGRKDTLEYWQLQAMSNLLAAHATPLQKYLNEPEQTTLEKCTQRSTDFSTYAVCFMPLWDKNKKSRKKRTKRTALFQQNPTDIMEPRKEDFKGQVEIDVASNDKRQPSLFSRKDEVEDLKLAQGAQLKETSIFGDVAEWISGFVHAIKEPKVIGDGKFIRKDDKKEEKKTNTKDSKYDNILDGTIIGEYLKELYSPVEGLSDLIFNPFNTSTNLKTVLRNHIKKSEQSALKENLPEWQQNYVEDSHKMFLEMANVSDEVTNNILLSPRLFPITKQEPANRILSPDILGFNEDSQDSIAPLPSLMSDMKPGDKQAWLKLIMEVSDVNDMAVKAGGFEELLKLKEAETHKQKQHIPVETTNMYGEHLEKYQEKFKTFYASMTAEQVDRMANRGYAFLNEEQLEIMYGNESTLSISFNKTEYVSMCDQEREEALTDIFADISRNSVHKSRRKKQVLFSPLVLTPSVLAPLVLIPVLFSPLILTPVVLGVVVLSPFLFTPLILSPTVLFPIVLSPFLFDPFILSPAVLDPVILSPLLFDPFILSPLVGSPLVLSPAVFTPFILSPLVLGGVILSPLLGDAVVLSPLVLFPIVLSPIVLNPFILSPLVLNPVILSPLVDSPLILNPLYKSPIIRSPIVNSSIILSPLVLSPLIKSPLIGSKVITKASQVLSPEFLSPKFNSPKRNFSTLLSPSILSRRKRSSATMP